MCTVTFIPVKDKYFMTSNRDEKLLRKQALPPAVYEFPNGKVIYPKDADAGGTWIAAHENGNVVVLLNGGFIKHIPAPPYKKSRGIILLELIKNTNPFLAFQQIDLFGIEPFTVIIFSRDQLFECRWDGISKHAKQLDKTIGHIWSSVTLYDEKTIRKREEWFKNFLVKNIKPAMQNIMKFHLFAGDGNKQNDIRMNRDNNLLTVSATCIEINNENSIMHYHDLKDNELYKQELRTLSAYAF